MITAAMAPAQRESNREVEVTIAQLCPPLGSQPITGALLESLPSDSLAGVAPADIKLAEASVQSVYAELFQLATHGGAYGGKSEPALARLLV